MTVVIQQFNIFFTWKLFLLLYYCDYHLLLSFYWFYSLYVTLYNYMPYSPWPSIYANFYYDIVNIGNTQTILLTINLCDLQLISHLFDANIYSYTNVLQIHFHFSIEKWWKWSLIFCSSTAFFRMNLLRSWK